MVLQSVFDLKTFHITSEGIKQALNNVFKDNNLVNEMYPFFENIDRDISSAGFFILLIFAFHNFSVHKNDKVYESMLICKIPCLIDELVTDEELVKDCKIIYEEYKENISEKKGK